MTDSNDKSRWKEEAQQLKDDLSSREKVVKKREVPIRFTKESATKKTKLSEHPPKHQTPSDSDDHLRRQLGLH